MSTLHHHMEVLVDAIRSTTEARLAGLQRLRSQTREDLGRFRRQRQETFEGSLELLRRRLEEIRETARGLRQATQTTLEGIASDVCAARRLWAADGEAGGLAPPATAPVEQPVRPGPAPTARPLELAVMQAPPAEPEEKRAAEGEQILRVLRAHPEGIRLVDIGNELGVDWRSLITSTKRLLDEGRIEKIDHLYYAVGETAD